MTTARSTTPVAKQTPLGLRRSYPCHTSVLAAPSISYPWTDRRAPLVRALMLHKIGVYLV